jgi:hypothetical protein
VRLVRLKGEQLFSLQTSQSGFGCDRRLFCGSEY